MTSKFLCNICFLPIGFIEGNETEEELIEKRRLLSTHFLEKHPAALRGILKEHGVLKEEAINSDSS